MVCDIIMERMGGPVVLSVITPVAMGIPCGASLECQLAALAWLSSGAKSPFTCKFVADAVSMATFFEQCACGTVVCNENTLTPPAGFRVEMAKDRLCGCIHEPPTYLGGVSVASQQLRAKARA